ncbi:prolyl-tRNA synthetase associated domain-containing protein [Candidatus Babeliales bacterium]|nr:prolyl-tRNA synthetase associated domain-containing protein [Candidatus Babeliales bacterium]MCF7899200.1 prolyl-tRNA synthetase associated domain-containing protein [Candidatus Babeliales bacterium]
MNKQILFDFLKNNNIEYKLFKHQPVFKTEDKLIFTQDYGIDTIPGLQSKNLFLKDKNNKFFLVSVAEDKRVDLKALNIILGCGRFSFGKAEELFELLKLTPGSVTPLGLLFDEQKKVNFVLDEDFIKNGTAAFHPLRNDMTVTFDIKSFLTCMKKMEHEPKIIQVPIIASV